MKPPEHGEVRSPRDIHILLERTVCLVCVCLCVFVCRPFVKYDVPACLYSICTSIHLDCPSPTLFPLSPALISSPLSLFFKCIFVTLLPLISAPPPFVRSSTHFFPPFPPPPLSSSPVYQTYSWPAAPRPAEPPAACTQTDGGERRWATAAADSGSDQQHERSKWRRNGLHGPQFTCKHCRTSFKCHWLFVVWSLWRSRMIKRQIA